MHPPSRTPISEALRPSSQAVPPRAESGPLDSLRRRV